MPTNIQNAFTRAREKLLKFDSVIGVGYGPKIARGQVVERRAIIVLVAKKGPPDKITAGQMVPLEIEGLPTDVREPKLMLDEHEDSSGMPLEELSDYQWIDWGKIHEIWLRQRMPPKVVK
jgi:hypothetical protein